MSHQTARVDKAVEQAGGQDRALWYPRSHLKSAGSLALELAVRSANAEVWCQPAEEVGGRVVEDIGEALCLKAWEKSTARTTVR